MKRVYTTEELINYCARQMNLAGRGLNLQGRAYNPNIFVYMGEYAQKNAQIVKDVIDAKWGGNANYIIHAALTCRNDEFIAESVGGDEKEPLPTGFEDFLDDAVIQLLKAPESTFKRKTAVTIRFIADITEKDFFQYLQQAANIGTSIEGVRITKELYLLLRQGGKKEDRELTAEHLQRLETKNTEGKLDCFSPVYFLSNQLNNRHILSGFDENDNYRIIGDLAVASNEDIGRTGGRLRTVTYRVAEKPCREIAVVILKKMLHMVQELPAEFIDRQGLTPSGAQFVKECYLKSFADCFASAEDYKHMPFERESLASLTQRFNGSKYLDEDEINRATGNCFEAFFDENYKRKLQSVYDSKSLKDAWMNYLCRQVTYKYILEYLQLQLLAESACKETDLSKDLQETGNIFAAMEKVHHAKIENLFRRRLQCDFETANKELKDKAESFSLLLKELIQELETAIPFDESGIYESLHSYYDEYVEDCFSSSVEVLDTMTILRIDCKEKLLAELQNKFDDILGRDIQHVLTQGFIDEMNSRLGVVSSLLERESLVRKELFPGIEKEKRLRVVFESFRESSKACFYDVSAMKLDVPKDVHTIDTKDKNTFEYLQVYAFDSISDIIGSSEESEE